MLVAQEQPDNFRISVDVELVMMHATVRDHAGHAVADLTQQDFQVSKDGKPQEIRIFRHEDSPVTIGLVVDHSGSMRNKLNQVTTAARTFVRASNRADKMFVVNFNEKVSLGLGAEGRFSDSAEELSNAIWSARPVGKTALYDAILEALRGLEKDSGEKKALIVISDGGDNASEASLDRILTLAEQSNALIYTIGIFDEGDADRNPKVLRRLAQETGGEAYFPAELGETVQICERIARDLRDQYTIGFFSSNGKAGAYHTLRLTAQSKTQGKLSVRTRAGYRSGGQGKPGNGGN